MVGGEAGAELGAGNGDDSRMGDARIAGVTTPVRELGH